MVKAATIVLVNRLPFSGDNVVTFVKSRNPLPVGRIEQKSLPKTHERSSVGARPYAEAFVGVIEQKPPDRIHESSSVGARPSPAAPVEQNPLIPTKLETV